jgi:hypothetical protein
MKTYLGDSVYAETDAGEIVLTTEAGPGDPSNRIVLEPAVYRELIEWAERMRSEGEL